ncbi:MAG: helicase [Alphaproteobacteria bacterium]|nr:helicase [Alphaproteobacteria bacterium]
MPPRDDLLRFTPRAAAALREEIRQAGGIEVFAIGDVDSFGKVSHLEVHCRGTDDAVPALLRRPRSGQVVIHNHPSGVLKASPADMALANRYGDEGVGVVITDNAVERALWVVEPARKRLVPVDRDRLVAFFERDLPQALGGLHEPRRQQLDMALAVADTLDAGGVVVVEAGTGTGKSLAYLVPSILWALANDGKVAVSTYTRTLQGQLLASDLPLVRRGGIRFTAALLKGRGNYLCRRKLELALKDPGFDAEDLARIADWVQTTKEGSLQDLGERVERDVWERVESDADHTLRARCPHYNTCFYYEARRRAAASHLIVLNHALLLADLFIKSQTDGDGILPRFDRVILDEGHHIEDAATSVISQALSRRAVNRAVAPLLARRNRPGALARIRERFADDEPRLIAMTEAAEDTLAQLRDEAGAALDHVAAELLGVEPQRRIDKEVSARPQWTDSAGPSIAELGDRLRAAHSRLGAITERLSGLEIPPEQAQPALEVGRAERRLGEQASLCTALLDPDPTWCRWVERTRRGGVVRVCRAPVEVGPVLQGILFDRMDAVGITSATLTVGGRFEHTLGRLGLDPAHTRTARFDSPFAYAEQALLGLPRDLPKPDHPDFLQRSGDIAMALLRASGGGAFVLCTSYQQVDAFGARIEAELGDTHPVLIQGRHSRGRLLRRFQESDGAILIGTDSFWEGVSVRGRALRLVLIPKLPFRVPTEPIAQARHELIRSRGIDPFRAYTLPEAVLKLRQGFGRLVRARSDRGAVVLLDRRLHEMRYGRIFLHSLPPATRVIGPGRVVVDRLTRFFETAWSGVY